DIASVNSILTISEGILQKLSHCHRLPMHLAGNLSNGNQISATNDALARQVGAHDAIVRTHRNACGLVLQEACLGYALSPQNFPRRSSCSRSLPRNLPRRSTRSLRERLDRGRV